MFCKNCRLSTIKATVCSRVDRLIQVKGVLWFVGSCYLMHSRPCATAISKSQVRSMSCLHIARPQTLCAQPDRKTFQISGRTGTYLEWYGTVCTSDNGEVAAYLTRCSIPFLETDITSHCCDLEYTHLSTTLLSHISSSPVRTDKMVFGIITAVAACPAIIGTAPLKTTQLKYHISSHYPHRHSRRRPLRPEKEQPRRAPWPQVQPDRHPSEPQPLLLDLEQRAYSPQRQQILHRHKRRRGRRRALFSGDGELSRFPGHERSMAESGLLRR